VRNNCGLNVSKDSCDLRLLANILLANIWHSTSRLLIGSGTDPISLLILFLFLFLLGRHFKKSKARSFQIGSGWNLAGLFFQVNTHRLSVSVFDVTSCFQHGGHDVRPPLDAAASAGWTLARPARVTSFARCMRYSSWSRRHWYMFVSWCVLKSYTADRIWLTHLTVVRSVL